MKKPPTFSHLIEREIISDPEWDRIERHTMYEVMRRIEERTPGDFVPCEEVWEAFDALAPKNAASLRQWFDHRYRRISVEIELLPFLDAVIVRRILYDGLCRTRCPYHDVIDMSKEEREHLANFLLTQTRTTHYTYVDLCVVARDYLRSNPSKRLARHAYFNIAGALCVIHERHYLPPPTNSWMMDEIIVALQMHP